MQTKTESPGRCKLAAEKYRLQPPGETTGRDSQCDETGKIREWAESRPKTREKKTREVQLRPGEDLNDKAAKEEVTE